MIYQKHNYITDIEYVKNIKIYEYDIEKAGLNIIHNKNLITDKEYEVLYNMEKTKRNKNIGLWLIKNPDVNKIMMDEFINIRKKLFEINKINDSEVISIKKDAIFITRKLNITEFDNYRFRIKNDYDSFIHNKEMKFECLFNKRNNKLDIKGMNKNSVKFQKDYFIDLIAKCMMKDLISNKRDLLKELAIFKYNFLDRDLDKEYYRDIKTGSFIFNVCGLLMSKDDITDDLKKYCYINYNLDLLNFLIRIF